MARVTRLPIVGVIGSGTAEHEARASLLASWLATQGLSWGLFPALLKTNQSIPNRAIPTSGWKCRSARTCI